MRRHPQHMRVMLRSASAVSIVLTSACASGGAPSAEPPPPSGGVTVQPAPWSKPALARADIPVAYRTEWEKAANRATCAILAPAVVGAGEGAVARAATFSGGWSVAYDLAQTRSAFGVAGTGVNAADPSYNEWPFTTRWADGSSAGYGPEGGTGPNQLAYLRVAGQGCLYNVWSRLGRAHLEYLLEQLRFVQP